MICLIKRILCSAVKNLFDNQPNIFDFTSQTGQTEWNLTHHLANEIHKYIFWLNYNLDVTKRNINNKRPDIIFHKRGINELNFLAIEVKYRDVALKNDIIKIKEDWMGENLKYRFGASIRIVGKNKYEVIIFDDKNNQEKGNQETKYLPIKRNSNSERKTITEMVDKIFALAKSPDYSQNSQKQAKVKKYKCQIDQLVYKLYGLKIEEVEITERYEAA